VRALYSHGLAALPPARIHDAIPAYDVHVRLGSRIRRLRFTNEGAHLVVDVEGRVGAAERRDIEQIARRVFRLDFDLGPFYAMIDGDARLSWARGAGRLLASPTVFEDVVKTICTTNCAWHATQRMVGALVELGGGAFPDAALLAATPERWYAQIARMGYRGPYIRAIARDVRNGTLDLEALAHRATDATGRDAYVEEALLALPGVGPYAAAHTMQLLGYHHRLVLDSWTRPTYLVLTKKKRAADRTIVRDFARYKQYAGLAFWLYLTRGWVEDASSHEQ
jgi:3-methyladenine DNA glycosylase/8-oxoguanine DNA glycosylase